VELKAGPIATVDWRKEPGDPERAIPDLTVPDLTVPDLTVVLQPSATNGCKKLSDLLPQHLTCVAKTRITPATDSCVTPAELQQLRHLVVLAIGGSPEG